MRKGISYGHEGITMIAVKILSGSDCIGGCFIRIEDEDRVLVFDQGLRFDIMSSFYSQLVAPLGLTELRCSVWWLSRSGTTTCTSTT